MHGSLRYLALGILLLLSGGATASAGINQRIETACRQYVLRQTQWPDEDVQIKFRRYRPPKIKWTGTDLTLGHSSNTELSGNVTLRVLVTKNGKRVRSFPVPVKITLYDSVVVTTDRVSRKHVLADRDLRIERREIDLPADRFFRRKKEVLGMRLRRSLTEGAILSTSAVEENPAILRGDRVLIKYESPGLILTAAGEALEDGWIGAGVRVKNLSSKQLINGVVAEAGVVEVTTLIAH